MKEISKGAEATIFLKENTVVKKRFPKTYRNNILDEKLRKERTKAEANNLKRAKEIAPNVLAVKKYEIHLDYVQGDIVKNVIEQKPQIVKHIATALSTLHDIDISHGDLTTSNMILASQEKVILIDFGLSKANARIEDKAIDVHILKKVLESTHADIYEQAWKTLKKHYKPKQKKDILARLQKIEARGRYK